MRNYHRLVKRLLGWLSNKVKTAQVHGVVIGLSGGLDSAVTVRLAQLALGNRRVLGLILPCDSSPADCADAYSIIRKFNIKTQRIDLTKVFRMLRSLFPPGSRNAVANLKPRLRMLALYYLANKLDYLVLGTGNKSEIMTGYFTKYGDGGVDLLPLGGLLKTEVRSLAQYLGIPQRIIDKPPSAGLWSGQTDEGELGISYTDLDTMLGGLRRGHNVRHKKSAQAAKIKRLIKLSKHKRMLPEIFVP